MSTRLLPAVATAAVIGLVAGAAGVWLLDDDGRPDVGDSTIAPSIIGAPDGTILAAGLEHAQSCDDLAATMQALTEEYGQSGRWFGGPMPMAAETTADAGGADEMASDDGASLAATDQGSLDATNVQEIGVDEPDIVERLTEDLLVVGTEGMLRVVDTSGATPVVRGELAVQEWGGDLGLFRISDTRVAVLAQGEGLVRADLATSMIRPGGWGTSVVALVDVADPDRPREVSRMEVEGWTIDARAVDGILRLAVRSEGPQIDIYAQGEFDVERDFDWENATDEDYERFDREYQAEYERRMEEALAQLQPEHWQPFASVDGRTLPLVDCDRIGFPTSFAGLGTLTLAAIDARGDSLAIDDSEAVVTSGENLYATTDRVVIATTRWDVQPMPEPEPVPLPEPEPTFEPGEPAPEPAPEPEPEPLPGEEETEPAEPEAPAPSEEETVEVEVLPMIAPPWMGWGGMTDLHVFDVEGTLVSHVASGTVDGNLLNQYSMSIHEGVLRTATTAFVDGRTESLVTTFRVEGTDLVQLGQVGDLGPNEDIQAVRFMGDTAYVVTFRRTDPLYVVDLSDPTAPRTRGELKIEGYSAYLHPLGGGQLLGIGQDADPETGITRGVQVSTFDVVDPTAPARIDVDVTPDSHSEVEWEPHALTVTADRLAIVPVEIWDASPNGRLGALLYRISGTGELQRVGMLNSGGDWQLRPRRTVDLGDQLLTIGERGVIAWDRTDFRVLDTVRFGTPSFQGAEEEFGDMGGGEPGFER